MTTHDFIIALFHAVDQEMLEVPKHPEAKLSPSEVVTLARLFAVKGGGMRAFYRWLTRDYLALFPQVPERTRLARLFTTHTAWTARFLAAPTVLGVADTYGIELLHPMREGHSPAQVGKKGMSNHRWMVGGKLCCILNQWGLMCAWDCATANVYDTPFHPLIAQFQDQMMVLTDTGFHAKNGAPANMKVCPRGTWNTRMVGETVWSMLTTVFQSKQVGHRVWAYFRARGAWTMAACNLLARWGLEKELQRLCHMAHEPPSGGQWQAWYARFCRLLERYQQRADDAGRLVRRWAREMASLWVFLRAQGVEPTNNHAERGLRFGVLWRKTSHGTDSDAGNRWVERTLSLRQTCRQLGQATFSVLVDAVTSFFQGRQPDLAWLY